MLTLRPYQQAAIASIYGYFEKESGNPLVVIPTAGEAPIIQAMLALGMGAGPAGALLITLPPISLPSMAMLARAFPPRVLALTAAAVVLTGLAAGLLAAALGF